MEIATHKFSRFLLGFALTAFLLVVFFITSPIMGMKKQSDGKMGSCLFSDKAGICTMTFTEHSSYLQSLLTTTAPQKALDFALLILLAVVWATVILFKRNFFLLSSYYTTRWRLYIKQNPHLSLFNPLREAFSQGILNPKIY